MTHLVLARCQPVLSSAPAGTAWLHPSEQQRYQSFTQPRRQIQFLASRWLARQLLSQAMGGDCADWPLLAHAGQPPGIAAHPELHLSISHSGDWLAVALAEQPVGVDIEHIVANSNSMARAEIVANHNEISDLSSQVSIARQATYFTRGWTLKEAWLKRHGLGLDFALMQRLHYRPTRARAPQAHSWKLNNHPLCLALVSASRQSPILILPDDIRLRSSGRWNIAVDCC